VCADPVHFMFWDDIRPAVFMHSFIAVAVLSLYSHELPDRSTMSGHSRDVRTAFSYKLADAVTLVL
jgi:phospholipase/lecithinase/hemolysin